MDPITNRKISEANGQPAPKAVLGVGEGIDELLALLAHCEASHLARMEPDKLLRKELDFHAGAEASWNLIEQRCGALTRIQSEVAQQMSLVREALSKDIRELLLEAIVGFYSNPTFELRESVERDLEAAQDSNTLELVYNKHMGDWSVEQYFDGNSPFVCLRTLELTKASVESVGTDARRKPEARALFDFLAVEMFARFDVALSDFGLAQRKEFFLAESPEVLLQEQRLQCVLCFLVRVGFMGEEDRQWIRGLEPAVFEGEVCRAFCLFLRDRGGVPIQGDPHGGNSLGF
jgi:hypothetical protein